MGELIRKVLCKRILTAAKQEVTRTCVQGRQLGVGLEGGAEGIIHVHKLIEEEYMDKGELEKPMAVVQTDEANCFGTLEFKAIRRAIVELVLSLGPWELWRQSRESEVEQEGVEPYKKE